MANQPKEPLDNQSPEERRKWTYRLLMLQKKRKGRQEEEGA